MRTMDYYGEMFKVAESAEEFISLLHEGDTVMSTRSFDGDESSYYCGSVPTYTYTEKDGEAVDTQDAINHVSDAKGFTRNAEDIRAMVNNHPEIELDVWREDTQERFFYATPDTDLSWHFEV